MQYERDTALSDARSTASYRLELGLNLQLQNVQEMLIFQNTDLDNANLEGCRTCRATNLQKARDLQSTNVQRADLKAAGCRRHTYASSTEVQRLPRL